MTDASSVTPLGGIIAPLFTGLGLFFCGVRFIAANLAPLAGPATRRLLRSALSTGWKAALAGIGAGLVTQSTNAVSLTVVGFVRAGVLPERRAALLPTWSHVGAAALVILVSLRTDVAVAYVLALAGAALYFDLNLSERVRHAVMALLGAAMLFLGMEMLRLGSDPLKSWLMARHLLMHGQAHPFAPLLVGAGLAVLTQSSTVAGAIAVALVRVGVFDLETAMVLLTGAGAGSAANYAILARRGEAVGQHILLFQAAQKLFGATLLGAVLLAPGGATALFERLDDTPAGQFARAFLIVQIGGSLACTILQGPLQALFARIAPPSGTEALGRPAFLVEEALADPELALDLAAREEQRLLERLPRMLDAVRAHGDRTGPGAEKLKSAGASVAEAIRRYLAGVLESEPGRGAVIRAMRLQRVLDNLVALQEAMAEFEADVRAAAGSQGAQALGRMVESLHMLLEVLAEITASRDAAGQQVSLALLGDRQEAVERLRARLMADTSDAPARVQEALFRSTVLFERILWLARDTATVSIRSGQETGPLPRSSSSGGSPAEGRVGGLPPTDLFCDPPSSPSGRHFPQRGKIRSSWVARRQASAAVWASNWMPPSISRSPRTSLRVKWRMSPQRPWRTLPTMPWSPMWPRPTETRSNWPASKRRISSAKPAAPVGLASWPKKFSITSMSSPTDPTAITGASVSCLVQPAIPSSEPGHSGIQNRRAEAWKTSTPAWRRIWSIAPSSSGVSATLAS